MCFLEQTASPARPLIQSRFPQRVLPHLSLCVRQEPHCTGKVRPLCVLCADMTGSGPHRRARCRRRRSPWRRSEDGGG
ncbi:hypothetical protein AAFF_G00376150, partial [Aldrovandia affinis]